jgi:hypothetical protein
MVDAFPRPRHREKSCCSRSRCSHKNPRFTNRAARSYSVTKNCVEIMRAILTDIQRGAEQLQMSMTMNNSDGSRRFTFSHTRNVLIYGHDADIDGNNLPDNAWRKLPKMGKKTFDGWPVRDSEGHVFQRTSTSINGNKLDEDKEGYTAAPQSEKAHSAQFRVLSNRLFLNRSAQTPMTGPLHS